MGKRSKESLIEEYLRELAWFRVKATGTIPTPENTQAQFVKIQTAIKTLTE